MARRAKNEGTIRKRPDGRYEARIVLGHDPGTGKPIRKSIYGKTQKEVRQQMQRAKVEHEDGVYTAPSKITVGQWLDIWTAEYCSHVKQSTRTSYSQHVKNHISPALGAVRLCDLTPVMVQSFYNSLQRNEKCLSAKTVKNIHGVLHQALKQAVEVGYIRMNPADGRKLPRIEKTEIQPMDVQDMRAFLSVLDDSEYSTLLKVDLFTGMREGEILGLQWSCVDFERGTITINKQLSRPRVKGEVYELTSTKNGKSRIIKPAQSVMDLLREHRHRQISERLRLGGIWDDQGFPDLVFTNATGSHLCYNVILKHYHNALDRAGIPRKRFHDLRHTYAVTSLRAGDDVKTVQENLGHHTAAFTLDVYGHVTESMKDASSKRMEAVISELNKAF